MVSEDVRNAHYTIPYIPLVSIPYNGDGMDVHTFILSSALINYIMKCDDDVDEIMRSRIMEMMESMRIMIKMKMVMKMTPLITPLIT